MIVNYYEHEKLLIIGIFIYTDKKLVVNSYVFIHKKYYTKPFETYSYRLVIIFLETDPTCDR